MSLEEKIFEDYKNALRDKQKEVSQFLSYVRAELKNSAKDKRKDTLEDAEVIMVLRKKLKQLEEALESARSAAREDLMRSAEQEVVILKGYLPEELTPDAVEKIVTQIISENNYTSVKDMGGVMKQAMEKMGTQADGKVISQIARKLLAN